MYSVIATDEKEYGPVDPEFIRKWIANGRLNAQSRIRREGSSEWVLLSSLPEFGLASAATQEEPPPVAVQAPRTQVSALAISSLVLGALGACGLTALAGLTLGIMALSRIKKSQGRLTGRRLAIGGIAVSCLFLVLLAAFFFGVALPQIVQAKRRQEMAQCRDNVRQITLAVLNYARANGGKFPPADSWCDAIKGSLDTDQFLCPNGDPKLRCHYAYNAKLEGVELSKLQNPASTVVIFEATGGWNLSGGFDQALRIPRHQRVIVVGFADGHVQNGARVRFQSYRWEP